MEKHTDCDAESICDKSGQPPRFDEMPQMIYDWNATEETTDQILLDIWKLWIENVLTPEMVEAGVYELKRVSIGEDLGEAVKRIFYAMLYAEYPDA